MREIIVACVGGVCACACACLCVYPGVAGLYMCAGVYTSVGVGICMFVCFVFFISNQSISHTFELCLVTASPKVDKKASTKKRKRVEEVLTKHHLKGVQHLIGVHDLIGVQHLIGVQQLYPFESRS